jgi:hypothetical protein
MPRPRRRQPIDSTKLGCCCSPAGGSFSIQLDGFNRKTGAPFALSRRFRAKPMRKQVVPRGPRCKKCDFQGVSRSTYFLCRLGKVRVVNEVASTPKIQPKLINLHISILTLFDPSRRQRPNQLWIGIAQSRGPQPTISPIRPSPREGSASPDQRLSKDQ